MEIAIAPTALRWHPPTVTPIHACRSCGGSELELVLDLGEQPLANALRDDPTPPARYPLRLVFCTACALAQIDCTVDPELLFSTYLYFSSVSDHLVAHAKRLAEQVVESRGLGSDALVIEAASNDGYLLQHYAAAGVPVLGVEPARNIAEAARRERGIETLCAFFGLEVARRLAAEGRHADVFHAHNVLAHVADLNGFVAGIRTLLRPDGVAIIEVPYVKPLLDERQFDTIYHEHLCYFSQHALEHLLARHQLALADVERIPIHGGSLRLFIEHGGATPSERVLAGRRDEEAWGAATLDAYRGFADRVRALKEELVALLTDLKGAGHRIAAYGAAAKGSTLLEYMGIDTQTLDYVVDRSPHKRGKLMPGVDLRIHGVEHLLADRPDYLLLLSWNFATEIMAQQQAYLDAGGRFIVPVPEPRIDPPASG